MNAQSADTIDDRHVAYLQVLPFTAIYAGDVVRHYEDDLPPEFETSDFTVCTVGGQGSVLGIADRDMYEKTPGTIVIAGMVSVYCADEKISLQGGRYVLANRLWSSKGNDEHASLQVVGTFVRATGAGKTVAGKWHPEMRIFLCPWVNAITLPVSAPPLTAQLNLQALFSEDAYANFTNALQSLFPDTDPDMMTPVIAVIQQALHAAITAPNGINLETFASA
jgi:hypothetical protein